MKTSKQDRLRDWFLGKCSRCEKRTVVHYTVIGDFEGRQWMGSHTENLCAGCLKKLS